MHNHGMYKCVNQMVIQSGLLSQSIICQLDLWPNVKLCHPIQICTCAVVGRITHERKSPPNIINSVLNSKCNQWGPRPRAWIGVQTSKSALETQTLNHDHYDSDHEVCHLRLEIIKQSLTQLVYPDSNLQCHVMPQERSHPNLHNHNYHLP